MQIIPAIDIKDGKCVRLLQGKFDQQTQYNADPVAQAEYFVKQGAKYLHVVDLDGALHGNPTNYQLIKHLVASTPAQVEVSGGIRTVVDIERYLEIKPWQIILGSMAVFDLQFVVNALAQYGQDSFSIALDSQDGYAASRGWVTKSQVRIDTLAQQLDKIGVKRFIFTDISRDGMLQGANIKSTVALKKLVKGQVIASGGVASLAEVRHIAKAGIDGVIIGKALYEGSFSLKEAINLVKS